MISTLFLKIKRITIIIFESIKEGKAQRAKFYMSSHLPKN